MSDAQPKLREDLVISRQGSSDSILVVKDPATGRFFRFREAEGFILEGLDGVTSLDSLRSKVEARFSAALPFESLTRFVDKLRTLGLLEHGEGPAPSPRSRGRIQGDFFYLRMKAFDPDLLFERLIARIGFCFTPQFLTASLALILVAAGVTVARWEDIRYAFATLYRVQTLLLVWLTLVLATTAHEFAHGLTCKRFGGKVHELGFMLLYLQPAFYCNVSDAWLFPEKSRRLWVTFAGAYLDLLLWALATLIWRATDPGSVLSYVALVVMATSGIKILFNLNPLIKLDGYYLLSDYLEIPNLRRRAFAYLRSLLKGGGSAMQTTNAATSREERIYLAYGLLAGIYSFWLLGKIVLWLEGFLTARYQGWGFVLFVGLLAAVFRHPLGRGWAWFSSLFRRAEGGNPQSNRAAKLAAIGAVLLAVLILGRMELKVSGEFRILPSRNADVRAEVEGIIEQIFVKEGDAVRKGDMIARLADRDYRAELLETRAEIEEKAAKLRMLKAGPRAEEIGLARTSVGKAQERLKYARNELFRMNSSYYQKVVSRKDLDEAAEEVAVREKELQEAEGKLGMLVAGNRPEEIEASEAELSRVQAHRSHLEQQLKRVKIASPISGIVTTPKMEEKIGQQVNKGDLIAAVHELKTVTAEIAVPEKVISEVRVRHRVDLKVSAYPYRSFSGKVTSIAPIATQQEEGRWGKMVRVTTQLDNSSLLLKPEMTGNAKIYCGKRRIIDVMTRRAARYLRVEFWSWW